MIENWKDIPDYNGKYQVSDLGNVRSIDRMVRGRYGLIKLKGRVLKKGISSNGYYTVNLSVNDKNKTFLVHQLVAIVFLNHKPNGHKLVIDHIDNNKLNNNYKNLQITTQRHNLSKNKKGTSRYTGVSWDSKNKKWIVFIRRGGVKRFLGRFDCEIEASKAYNLELKKVKNEH